MKKLIIAAAVLAATVTTAQAKCSKAAMEGDWLWSFESSGAAYRVTFADGNLISGGAVIGTYTMAKSCKGSVTILGTVMTSRTEKIEEDSSMKPGLLSFGYEDGAGHGMLWHMVRL